MSIIDKFFDFIEDLISVLDFFFDFIETILDRIEDFFDYIIDDVFPIYNKYKVLLISILFLAVVMIMSSLIPILKGKKIEVDVSKEPGKIEHINLNKKL